MYRLLIVDDEPYTVDGLYEFLQEADLPEIEMYKAYSAEEALQRLDRAKFDLVISDIRMPGMNGLQLQKKIKARWPACRVIFLTGINDADYVREALREGSADYLLKTEGDEPILAAIRKAIGELERELMNERVLTMAEARLREALPALRNDWFRRLLQYGIEENGLSQTKLDELECPLQAKLPVLLIVGRVDRWPTVLSATDRSLLMYAIENVVQEHFEPIASQWIAVDESYFTLLAQPRTRVESEEGGLDGPDDSPRWERAVRFAQGALDTVQTACARLLKLSVSVVCGREPIDWVDLTERSSSMRNALVVGVGDGNSMMLLNGGSAGERATRERDEAAAARRKERFGNALENGDSIAAREALEDWFQGAETYPLYVEAYYAAANRLLRLANRWGVSERPGAGFRLEELMNIRAHPSREEAILFLQETADRLIRDKRATQQDRAHCIVDKVNRIIRERMQEDVSLTALADAVYLNPTYLSMLYKQVTGANISEIIVQLRLERAKELLADSRYKIHEVAAAIGFDNAGYFARFFRKHAGVGPQEYRNQSSV
ncbi:response regulator transcription factor [Paenibacillus antri]|uniref:response regulator transcription factor n=1 Tax=Paenibacillus antri TaxID=2582848 RepID=UPI00130515CA|nr:response regulator [Paenibacillus antri]